MIKVFGHKSPDTDTVCSAIAYAWYLKNKKNKDAEAFVQGELNKETLLVLNKFKIEKPEFLDNITENDEVIVVDTNNPEELPDNINYSNLIEVIDHHKLAGGLITPKPIKITIRPIACTATIIWQQMQSENNTDIPDSIAGILFSAIISDTLKFTSPTTTDQDKKAAVQLAKIAKIDIDKHTEEMFKAKSDLSGMSPKDILLSDSKLFDMSSKKVLISVLETTKPSNAMDIKGELEKTMGEIKKEQSLDVMFFFIIDILKSEATLIVPSKIEKEITEKAFESSFKDGLMILPKVVSRKKQIVPVVEKALK